MKQELAQILKTKTIQHSFVTISGTLINGVLGGLFFLILARSLGPQNFGILSFSIVVLTLIADIADLGVNTGVINFMSKHFLVDQLKVKQVLKLSLESKVVVWLLILIIGWQVMPYISNEVLQKPELDFYLRLSLVGAGGAMLFSLAASSLQAMQFFKQWSLISISMNAVRLIVVLILIYGLILTPTNAMIIYLAVTFLGFLISLIFLPKDFITTKNEIAQFGSLFHFNKWVALTIMLSAISSRIDSIFLTKIGSLSQVGIYSVASQLASYVPQLSTAIAVVVAPKFGSFTNKKDATAYFYKLQLLCIALGLMGLLIIPVAWFLIPAIYGSSYQESSLIFALLFLGNLIFFISTPAHQAIYYFFSSSKVAFFITLFIFVMNIFLMWFMISWFGLMGAALSVLLISLLNFIISTFWVVIKLQNNEKDYLG